MERERQGGLSELSRQECVELLRAHAFGRLAVTTEAGPMIFPVNYIFDDPSIVIHSAIGAKTELAPLTIVAFEIDEVGPEGAWGWSVIARGPAHDVTDATDEYSRRSRELRVDPWVPGTKDRVLRVNAREISGRRFGKTD